MVAMASLGLFLKKPGFLYKLLKMRHSNQTKKWGKMANHTAPHPGFLGASHSGSALVVKSHNPLCNARHRTRIRHNTTTSHHSHPESTIVLGKNKRGWDVALLYFWINCETVDIKHHDLRAMLASSHKRSWHGIRNRIFQLTW